MINSSDGIQSSRVYPIYIEASEQQRLAEASLAARRVPFSQIPALKCRAFVPSTLLDLL